MTVIVTEPNLTAAPDRSMHAHRDRFDPSEPGRRFFSVELACVTYTVVARDEAHLRELLPSVYSAMCGGEPDRSYEDACAEYGLGIAEIDGSTTIWDDGRDGLQHPINTYALGCWASSEY